jgi:hypothetical protein
VDENQEENISRPTFCVVRIFHKLSFSVPGYLPKKLSDGEKSNLEKEI